MLKIATVTKPLMIFSFSFALLMTGIHAEQADNRVNAPTNFYIDIINEDDVILLWEENQDPDVKEFTILKAIGNDKAPEKFATVQATESSFIDSEVEVGKSYTYRVQANANSGQIAITDPKSIVIQTSITNTPISDIKLPTTTLDSTASELLDPESDNFWSNLVAVNMLIFGLLLLVYMLLRYLIVDRDKRNSMGAEESLRIQKLKTLKQAEDKPALKINLKMKSDHEHPNVVEKAKDRVYNQEKKKIGEWVDASL